MNARRTLATLFWGALLGIAIAIPSNDRRFSVEVWFAVFSIWAIGTVIVRLFFVTPVASTSRILLWRWLRRVTFGNDDEDQSLLGPRSTQNLMQRACAAPRAHVRHLRPRLQELVNYYLPIHYGVDPQRRPAQVREVLGPVFWMIDDSVNDRSPTPAEIEQFLDTVVGATVEEGPAAEMSSRSAGD